ncbi:ankyrin repeat-containing protein, partial [Fusarium sp. NRRL 25303]
MIGIHEAAKFGNESALLELLQDPTFDKINARDKKNCTPLWIACREGHTAIVRTILNHAKFDGGMVNTICESNHTALQIAVCFRRDEIVKLLLAQPEIELNTRDMNGHTPLTLALKKGFESTVNLLLDMEDIDLGLDGHGRMPLSMAFESGQLTIASKILNATRRRNPSKTNQTLLSWASQNDERDVVRQINNLSTINPNLQDGDGDTPLSKAAERGNLSMVRLLLENSGVDVNSKNKDGSTPMSRAAMNQHQNVVQLLAAKDNVTLHSIIRAGNQPLTHYLVSCDIDLNLKDTHGLTALHIAIISRQLQIFEMLLLGGADIDAKDGTGRTPLILAAQYTLRDFVELLLSRSACMKGIQIRDWQRIYNCHSPESNLYVSERAGGRYQVQFIDTKRTLQYEPEVVRNLIQVSSFTACSSFLIRHKLQNILPKSNKHIYTAKAFTQQDSLAAVAVAVWVPHTRMFTQSSGWDECGIAWTIGDIVEDLGFGQKTKYHISMLPDGWIPQNGIDFFQQLILHLTARWSELCTGAEDHLSERRMKQLQEKGRLEIINDLAGDAKNLAELRRCLRTQVLEAKIFVEDYGRSQGVDVDGQAFKTIESFAKIDNLLQELDQTIRDLLQLEFAWVSINEAHKSTSLATSMKRLSWITFIFLPAMFTS